MEQPAADNGESKLSFEQIRRYYQRGKVKMRTALRIENILKKVLDIHTYFKEMKKLNIAKMDRIKHNHHRVI